MWKWFHIQHYIGFSFMIQWLTSFLWIVIKLMASIELHDKTDDIKKNASSATYNKMAKSILCNNRFCNIVQSSRHRKTMIKLYYWTVNSDDGEYKKNRLQWNGSVTWSSNELWFYCTSSLLKMSFINHSHQS